MKDGLALQKGFERRPRADLGSVMEGTASSEGKKWWMNQGVVEKVTHYLSTDVWGTEASGVLSSKTPKGASLPARLAQYEAFLQDTKQCPGGRPAAAQLQRSLTCHEVLPCACPQMLVLGKSSSPGLTEPSQEASENWSQSQAASLFTEELLLRGTKWDICWERPHQAKSISWAQCVFYPFWYPFWLSLCHNAGCYWCISIKQAEKYWHYPMLFLDSLEWDCLSKLPRPFSSM